MENVLAINFYTVFLPALTLSFLLSCNIEKRWSYYPLSVLFEYRVKWLKEKKKCLVVSPDE